LRRQAVELRERLTKSEKSDEGQRTKIREMQKSTQTAEADARQLRREAVELRKTFAQSEKVGEASRMAVKADNDELLEQIAKVRASNDDLCQKLATAQEGQRDNHTLSAECVRLHKQQESAKELKALVLNQLTAAHEKGSQTQKQLKRYQGFLTASKNALEAVMREVNESEPDQNDAEERCLAAENVLREKLANTMESETQVCSHLGEELGRAVATEMEVHCRYQEGESELQETREQNQELREDLRLTLMKLEKAKGNDRQWQAEREQMHEDLRRERSNNESRDKEADVRDLALQRRNEQLREELAQSLSQTRDLHRVLKELSSARAAESQAKEVMADCRRQSLTLQRRCNQMRDQLVGLFREDGRSS